MDDIFRDASDWQATAQPKAVFSYAMTVMDKIHGWGEEEKWVGSWFVACLWPYTKCVRCDQQETTQYLLKRRMLPFGSVRKFWRNMSGYPQSLFPWKKKCRWNLIANSMFFVWSLKIKISNGLSWHQNHQVPRGYKLGNWGDYQCSLRSTWHATHASFGVDCFNRGSCLKRTGTWTKKWSGGNWENRLCFCLLYCLWKKSGTII